MNTERDIKYCLSEGIPREDIIRSSDTPEEKLADISGVFRRYNKLRPSLTPEEAIEEIRKIVNKEDPDQCEI